MRSVFVRGFQKYALQLRFRLKMHLICLCLNQLKPRVTANRVMAEGDDAVLIFNEPLFEIMFVLPVSLILLW